MDIFAVLFIFFLLATIIKIATDNVAELFKPFKDITKYKLVIAFVLTTTGVIGLNQGILEVLNVPLEVSRSWFHYFDLILTSLFLTGGAQGIHKLADAWKEYKGRKEIINGTTTN